jgi:ATP-binding cassette subfamily F protein 3
VENLIQLQKGSKGFGSKTLFDAASFAVNENEHVGVIGPNGAGKTTLFKILTGEETLDSGSLVRSRKLRLGYLSQHDQWTPGETVESYVERGASMPIWEMKALGAGLGLDDSHYASAVDSLSGGYRMRAKLLRLIGSQPNLMLLDEPTNYLDLETLLVLEKFLQGFDGAFLLISHDREFLRRTTDHTLEVEAGDVVKYNGNIDDYFEQKEMLRVQTEARALSLEEKRQEVLDFVARFGAKASKASQAQSRLKSLDRMETIELKSAPVTARIRIPAPARIGKMILHLKSADLGYGEKKVLSNVELRLSGGDHLAVVGLNGAGKSTLLKALAGRLRPLRGELEYGFESTIAFFNQFVAEDLDPSDTVLQAMKRKAHTDVLPQDVLDLAGSLLFSGDDAKKQIRVLSGGERSRVALGQVLLQKASCLILDEPTNHLDFQTVEALTQALQSFPGALIIVSHDRSFVRRIGTKILEIHHGHAGVYPGTYDEYVWSMERGAYRTLHQNDGGPVAPGARKTADSPGEGAIYRERRKTLDKRLRQLDTKIGDLDKKLAKDHEALSKLNDELAGGKSEGPKTVLEMGKLQSRIDASETEWMEAVEERETVVRELEAFVKKD